MSNGGQMRKVPPASGESEGPILSPPRPRATPKTRGFGLFGAAGNNDGVRKNPPVQAEVSDFDGSVRNELLRLLKLPLSDLDIEPDPDSVSVGQYFALILMRKAVKDQTMNAIIEVLDRLEGKATKAAQNKPNNGQLYDQLDANIKDLNDLTENS